MRRRSDLANIGRRARVDIEVAVGSGADHLEAALLREGLPEARVPQRDRGLVRK
jgi:hypothetical protein